MEKSERIPISVYIALLAVITELIVLICVWKSVFWKIILGILVFYLLLSLLRIVFQKSKIIDIFFLSFVKPIGLFSEWFLDRYVDVTGVRDKEFFQKETKCILANLLGIVILGLPIAKVSDVIVVITIKFAPQLNGHSTVLAAGMLMLFIYIASCATTFVVTKCFSFEIKKQVNQLYSDDKNEISNRKNAGEMKREEADREMTQAKDKREEEGEANKAYHKKFFKVVRWKTMIVLLGIVYIITILYPEYWGLTTSELQSDMVNTITLVTMIMLVSDSFKKWNKELTS